MEVRIEHPRLVVRSILHIHSPVRAFISIDYALENDPTAPGVLCYVPGTLRVHEDTARFDFVTKGVLRAIDIKSFIGGELEDPAEVIRKTLPHRLRSYGFNGQIGSVRLEVDGNVLHVLLTGIPDAAPGRREARPIVPAD